MLRKFTSSTNISSYSLTSGGNDCTLKTKQDQFWIGKYSYMTEKQRFLTIAEAAEFLHVSETSLRRWTNSGNLRCFRVGVRGERRFQVEDLLEFVASGKVQQEPPSIASEIGNNPASLERHICLFFRNLDEQWQMMRPYLLDHLGTRVPVLYIQDGTPPERLLELLRAEGLPVGYDRVFLTGEMTWSLPNAPGAEGMMHYEALLTPLVDTYPRSTIAWQY